MPREAFDVAHKTVCSLVKSFRDNERFYLSAGYVELQARIDFIDKFFVALGWDVNHERQRNPYEQEVKVERPVRADLSQRKADYAFYVAPNYSEARVYVEAKSPDGAIATRDNCFQAVRYGWNGNTPIAVLTSFEELYFLDSRFKPEVGTSTDQIIRRHVYRDFLDKEKFAEVYFLLSREAVANGALAKLAADLPRGTGKRRKALFKPGLQRIDNVFLAELDEHRRTLARAAKAENPKLTGEALTEITQRILDRLVFIRFLEDRLIEPHYLVSEFGSDRSVWRDFVAASRRLDNVYNGIVFKQHDIIDSPDFELSDKVFGAICQRLSHRNSPYDFNTIPIHILGSIYERFLGKVIVVKGKSADIKEKPEVRKAGGVYYTPEYIVQYIVEETVARMIAGRSEDALANFRFADLACGSGSFLLAVYDSLLRHYTRYYERFPKQAEVWAVVERDGVRRLTLRKKRQILLRHIYGVDIDNQAIEVANLALYLKLLDEETPGSAHDYQLSFREALLPPLNQNLVAGNSLLEPSALRGHDFDDETERKINAMDFADRFPSIVKRGGFDAVVGNPPYVGNDTLPDDQKQLYRDKYRTGKRFDLYQCFIEEGISRLKPGGRLGLILPNTFLTGHSYDRVRELLLDDVEIIELVDLPQGVFENVTVDNVLLFVRKKTPTDKARVRVNLLAAKSTKARVTTRDWDETYEIKQKSFGDGPGRRINLALVPRVRKLFARVERECGALDDDFDVCDGLIPYETEFQSRRSAHTGMKRRAGWSKLIRGRALSRYAVVWKGEWINYGPHLWRKREQRFFAQPKILLHAIRNKSLVRRLVGGLDESGLYNTDNLVNVITKPDGKVALEALLALLNSRFVNFWYRLKYPNVNINPNELLTVPVPKLEKYENELVRLSNAVIAAQSQFLKAKSERDKEYFGGKVKSLDREIEKIVSKAYRLSDRERALMEAPDIDDKTEDEAD